jgi:uncharacterized OB-fold protein
MTAPPVDGPSAPLHAELELHFDYTRSLGPVLSRFIGGLRQRRLYGGVLSDGRVAVPPPEFDPGTHGQVTELVRVADVGTVQTWAWVPEPLPGQPLEEPFAFALVLLDGADTAFLQAVKVGSAAEMETGMRVRAHWAREATGSVRDLAWFEPVGIHGDEPGDASEMPDSEPDPMLTSTPVTLSYDYTASPEESAFGRGLRQGRILAQACPVCHKVYCPPRGACPVDGVPTSEPHELRDSGIVTTFCSANVPFLGQKIQPPYVSAYVLLDGADIAFLHLVLGCDASEVRMGMRVKAVWKPEEERTYSLENISHFEPTGEADADFETYRRHL